jgi:hypothetical protein
MLNLGMSAFTVGDKLPPVWVDCPTDIIVVPCYQVDDFAPLAVDNCTLEKDMIFTKVDHSIVDNKCNFDWPNNVMREIHRTYVAKDASGNLSVPCKVTIRIITLTPVEFFGNAPTRIMPPANIDILCVDKEDMLNPDGSFNADSTGWPALRYRKFRGIPEFDTLLLNNNCDKSFCNLASTYVDVKLNTCPDCVERTIRFWTIVETSCHEPQRMRMFTQTITVIDNIDPVIICPKNVTITTNVTSTSGSLPGGPQCGAMYRFPRPVITDDCCEDCDIWTISVKNGGHPILFVDKHETATGNPIIKFLPTGVNEVTYTAFDKCGNQSSCTFYVTVEDKTPPVAVCQQFTTVSVTYGGEAIVFAHSFDSGSYDDCAIDRIMVRRMDDQIECDGTKSIPANKFYESVKFCCNDIPNNNIMVVMRVWDKANNWNDCMVQVNVQDKMPPTITCPPSMCIECDFPFDIKNMESVFGTVVQGQFNVGTHSIHNYNAAPYYQGDGCGKPEQTFTFHDGWAHDNCALTITPTYVDHRDQCGVGQIVRTFTAADPNGSVNCTQRIYFRDTKPFGTVTGDIIFPADVTLYGCSNPATALPEDTGYPILNERPCHIVGAHYNDIVFRFNDDNFNAEEVCYKILREWTVIDWCQKTNGQYARWYGTQIIKISETEKPYFTSDCVDKTVCTYDSECKSGYIELTMSSADACTAPEDMKWQYRIDLYNNGSFDIDSKNFPYPHNIISGPSANASKEYPIGTHRIVWTTWDQCGNKISCQHLFTIMNCKKPTPVCIDNVVAVLMPVDTNNDGIIDDAMIELTAKISDHCCFGSFHPCGYPLTFSFSSDVNDVKRVFDCSHLGNWPMEMWVTAHLPDGSITQDFCVTKIRFQDNSGICGGTDPLLAGITGSVTNINDDPINDVQITVQGSEIGPQFTDKSGNFSFTVGANREYVLMPDKSGDDLNGISTLDLVLIQKHILNMKLLDNPYLILAANANMDDRISASDILILRRLILGEVDKLNKSWRFIPKNFQFANPANPLAEVIPGSESILPTADMKVDFYGIKLGDLNLSHIQARNSEKLIFATDSRTVEPGTIQVPFYADNIDAVEGFQFTIEYDADVLAFTEIESVELKSFGRSNTGLRRADNGIITVSWNKSGHEMVNSDEPLFIMHFDAKRTAEISDVIAFNSSVVRKEAYNSDHEVMGVELNFRGATNEFALYQNTPNPFSEYTDINFFLPGATFGKLTVSDVSGRTLMVREGDFAKGMNTIRINKSEFNASGIMYYRLDTGSNTAIRKMVLIK